MLSINRWVFPSADQWNIVVKGMRNAKNSWDRSDSTFIEYADDIRGAIGPNDLKLMKALAMGGPVHGKFLRMLPIYIDITAPLYWWKEFDTYKVGTVCNSCSTMHRIQEKEFTLDMFSVEDCVNDPVCMEVIRDTIDILNKSRRMYFFYDELAKNDEDSASKNSDYEQKLRFWNYMIHLLPSSYNQTRTVMLNYEVFRNIVLYRSKHKLKEWHILCDWGMKNIPYFGEIVFGKDSE